MQLARKSIAKVVHPISANSPVSNPRELESYLKYFGAVAQSADSTLKLDREQLALHNIRLTQEHFASTFHLYNAARIVVMLV